MDDRDPHRFALGFRGKLRRRRQHLVDTHHRGKRRAPRRLGGLVVSRRNQILHSTGVAHRFHEGNPGDAVVTHPQDDGLIIARAIEDLLDGGVAEQGGHPAVVGRRSAPALDVTKNRHSRVLAGTFLDGVGDQLRG